MGTSKCLLLMRALILTTLAIIVAMNAALIVALVIRKDCGFAELMGLPNTILMLFGLLSFDFTMYLAFQLLWAVRSTVDDKICSQVLLERGHDYGVGNKENPLIGATYTDDHVLGGFEDTIKALGTGLDSVLNSKCKTNLQEQVMVVDGQDETFDTGDKPLSKIPQDLLGQTVGKEASICKALHVEPTESFACHDSFFLSEHEGNVRNLILPYGQVPMSKSHSTKNMLDMINYLATEGFANGEVVRNDISVALSQQVAKLVSVRCNEIAGTWKFNNENASSMDFGRVREFFSAHLQFADILDEFWGNLFDLHGKLTEKGKTIRLDLLIGLDVEDKIQSCPCCFDGMPGGLCDPLKPEDLSTVRIPPLFRISNSICPQQGNCTLPAVVELRRCIMDSFLKENSSLLRDDKVSYFVMENDPVQNEVPIYENFHSVSQYIVLVSNSTSYWAPCPLEELNTMPVLVQKCPSQQVAQQAPQTNVYFSYNELKGLLLNSFVACIQNISDLEKSDWLIQHRGGYDEKLVGLAAEMVIFGDICPSGKFNPNAIVYSDGKMFNLSTSVLGCGDACMWQPSLIISFGVWCISRIFEVLPSVKQPVLFGKYSRVLNRLQGILDTAFLNPVHPVSICPCTDTVPDLTFHDGSQRISAEAVLKNLMEVEAAIYGQKRAGVKGKGKKNLKFVLKRYKRWLFKAASMAGQK
ncbi:uncharacterized protein LOC133918006 [Phragmites australis]|uniref:uncharacterized protein LOC133918006 n=1 Tax=Phragmites australis TaxID=29695 RepID=UPI002D7895DB|nr:uncharacterized protein LOC133918006 [Phragmites australis]